MNNAGLAVDTGLLADVHTEGFEQMIRVNVLGVFWCMKFQVCETLHVFQGRAKQYVAD